ncbi:MAG: hypothetical protein P8J27_15685 [Mariniblastus sp.]|nr:hypothetical protein [Mariniblastus sp.]
MKEVSVELVNRSGSRKAVSANVSDATNGVGTSSNLVWGALVLLIACFLLGMFACELNQQLYQHRAPFYDSLSYNEKMFRVMTTGRESGFADAMEWACFTNNTNCLPFIIGAAIAKLVEPSRLVGVWIQTGLFFSFLVSLLYYLVRIRQLSVQTSLAGCLAFLCARCLFLQNGGLSDFRMDLSLFIGFAMTSVWFLTAMDAPKPKHFLMVGISAAICCLFRATAPIYFLFSLGPLLAFELLPVDQRKQKLMGILIATLAVVLLAGWFFAINFEFLRYYYFEWNTDANAKIPFTDALQHWNTAQGSVGEPLAFMIICWGVTALLVTRKSQSIGKWMGTAIRHREVDWRIAWLGLSPVVLMVARRAGLNPFVSMPAVFGLILFFTLPCLTQMDRLNDKFLKRFCWGALLVTLVMSSARGWSRHTRVQFDSMGASHQLVETILKDAKAQGLQEVTFSVAQITDLDANILYSTLLFDWPDASAGMEGVTIDGVRIRRIAAFAYPAEADWKRIPGGDDESKIQELVADSDQRVDYLIIADDATAQKIPKTMGHNVVNRHLVRIRELVTQNPNWVPIQLEIHATKDEFVQVLRNDSRH